MKRALRWMSAVLAVYLAVWLVFGTIIGYLQPQDAGTAVLTTFDSEGNAYRTIVRPVVDESGRIWILSGQWFRSWYDRALKRPMVELQRDAASTNYQAIPAQKAEVEMILEHRRGNASSVAAFMYRALFLFAPIKVLKLDPIP